MFFSYSTLWYNHMCLLIWTVFSGERCGSWASCLIVEFLKVKRFLNLSDIFIFTVKFKFEELENINTFYHLLSYSIYSTRSLSEFYIFIENAQPEEDGKESCQLETVVNGEVHVFPALYGWHFCWHGVKHYPINESYLVFWKFYRIRSKKCFN